MTKTAKWITLVLLMICLVGSTVLGVISAKKISEIPFGETDGNDKHSSGWY